MTDIECTADAVNTVTDHGTIILQALREEERKMQDADYVRSLLRKAGKPTNLREISRARQEIRQQRMQLEARISAGSGRIETASEERISNRRGSDMLHGSKARPDLYQHNSPRKTM